MALKICGAETKALVKDGAQIQTGVHVRLEKKQGRLKAYLNGTHQTADHIILCAGHQTGTLLTSLGLNLPITPVRGFALDFDLSSIESNYLPQMPVMDAASHSALTCQYFWILHDFTPIISAKPCIIIHTLEPVLCDHCC